MKSTLKYFPVFLFFLLTHSGLTQDQDLRLNSHSERESLFEKGVLSHMEAQNIGPTVFSGRVSDISVNPDNPAEFYVAYASGGLWHTKNNGTTFDPIFDHEAVITIGDVAINWKEGTIWLGTGEVNSSRSSYAGVGMYKSTDNGKNWTYHGLPESHHIGRIVLHPDDSNIAWVAVLGHLYTTNPERGVYKTIDGGASWNKTLYVDDNSGAVDLVIDPNNTEILYAATWDRIRYAWDFQESGVGSGIYKSMDGGETWIKMNQDASGFPNNEGTGRIGLDAVKKDGKTIVYAILDNYNRRAKEDKEEEGLDKSVFVDMDSASFEALKEEDLSNYLKNNGFPKEYSVKKVKKMVKEGTIKPIALKEYVETANSLLFDTPVIGAEVYSSSDEGKTWSKTHDYHLDGLYNSYGYYFGQIRIDPSDSDKLYIMGVPILRSEDAGATWKNINGGNVHADHHALWINPNQPGHIINGNDGGINISYDHGENWIKCNSPSVGQFYYINTDNAETYNVYGGTQDNGVWVGNKNYNKGVRWQMRGAYPYKSIMGGDGMQVQIDNRDNNTVYTGFQFGNYFRINKNSGSRSYITPKHKLGDRPYRWNWQAPILLSPHNQDILYMGNHKLIRSMDKGSNFTEISGDLTNGGKKGDVAFGTLTTISESPKKFGLIYTGSDDGKVYRTKDGGDEWTDITAGLPSDKWVSRLIASEHSKSRVLLSLNGYRDDDFTSYVYLSEDYGDTWKNISNTLPSEPVNVIKEDPKNEDIFYVGTDHGTYASIDGGENFMPIGKDMPRVPVHDVVVQSRDGELLVGTHGRSIYKIDIKPLQELQSVLSNQIHLYAVTSSRFRSTWGKKFRPYSDAIVPSKKMTIFSSEAGMATFEILAEKEVLLSKEIELKKGISTISHDLSFDPEKKKKLEKFLKNANDEKEKIEVKEAENGMFYLMPGEYTFQISMNGKSSSQTFNMK